MKDCLLLDIHTWFGARAHIRASNVYFSAFGKALVLISLSINTTHWTVDLGTVFASWRRRLGRDGRGHNSRRRNGAYSRYRAVLKDCLLLDIHTWFGARAHIRASNGYFSAFGKALVLISLPINTAHWIVDLGTVFASWRRKLGREGRRHNSRRRNGAYSRYRAVLKDCLLLHVHTWFGTRTHVWTCNGYFCAFGKAFVLISLPIDSTHWTVDFGTVFTSWRRKLGREGRRHNSRRRNGAYSRYRAVLKDCLLLHVHTWFGTRTHVWTCNGYFCAFGKAFVLISLPIDSTHWTVDFGTVFTSWRRKLGRDGRGHRRRHFGACSAEIATF